MSTLSDHSEETAVDYVYVESRGAHGVHAHGSFDAFVGSQREIWVGSDGSGLIRETSGPVEFFDEAGKERWVAAGSPRLAHGPSLDLFAPGCLGRSRARLASLPSEPEALEAALTKRGPLTLHLVQNLLGEALVEPDLCRALYKVAARLPGVEVVSTVADQLGRPGRGLAVLKHGHRLELVFDDDTTGLLAYQRFLIDPAQTYAPVGTLVSWQAFLSRQLVDELPPGTPPTPGPPCSPPGGGRGTVIRPGFHISTGYVDDKLSLLDGLHAQGVITDDEYETAKSETSGG